MPQDRYRISGLAQLVPGTHYNYTRLGHTLVIATIRPSKAEVAALMYGGEVTFGLYVEDRVLFFLCNLGSGWTASHYNWWLNLPELRPNPQNEDARDTSISLAVRLVNAANGRTEAENTYRIPAEPAAVLRQCVCDQIERVLDPWDHLETAHKVLAGVPNLEEVLRKALWIVSCRPILTDESALREKRYGCRMV